jgi:hypothetical protein
VVVSVVAPDTSPRAPLGSGASGDAGEQPRVDKRPSPFALLFAPDRGMEHQAKVGRAMGYVLFAWLAALLLAGVMAVRVDARASTLKKLDQNGQLQGMSDRQLADESKSAERVFQVATIAKGVASVPAELALASLAVISMSWFLRGRTKGSAVVPVAAATLAPNAIAKLLDAGVALRHALIPIDGVLLSPRTLAALLGLAGKPLGPPWLKLADALDFYSLWSAVMVGYGVAAVGSVPKRRALVGTLVAWVCYRLLTHVAASGG